MNLVCYTDSPRQALSFLKEGILALAFETDHGVGRNENRAGLYLS